MITGKEDLLEALSEAFVMEKGTRVFYSGASEKVMNASAREMFRELSEWEGKHEDFILFLYQSVLDNREMRSFEQFKENAEISVTEAGIPIKEMNVKMENHTFDNESDAIQLALEIEGKAFSLYRRLSREAEDSNAQVVFREMMEQEVKHIEYLKQLKGKLTNS